MMERVFTLTHTDDYRSGPSMIIGDGGDNDDDDDDITFVATFLIDKEHFFAYQITFGGCGDNGVTLLEKFSTFDQAYMFVRKCYKQENGEYPFQDNGILSASYHPDGKRQKMDGEEEEEEEEIELTIDHNGYTYIVIVSKDSIESYSLNPYSVW